MINASNISNLKVRVFIPQRATAKTLVGAGHMRLQKFIACLREPEGERESTKLHVST